MYALWKTRLGNDAAYDPQYHDHARVEIASFVTDPPGLTLDVGCGGGAAGRTLKQKFPGIRVIGIENNPQVAAEAKTRLDEVIVGSVDSVSVADRLRGEPIALVLLLDVLEHLYDPWGTLVRIRSWLAPGTRVLASVPNVRNLVTLDDLAAGRWEYEPDGVLDITHLRFFTKTSLRELFEETGYDVLEMVPIFRPETADHYIVDRQPGRLKTRNLSISYRDQEDLEDLYTFQYVVEARARERNLTPTASIAGGGA
jgi:2-polyprenyl-3-methyl-5-hydroxy-6-metoxy-1,4-benzoquinol methylase